MKKIKIRNKAFTLIELLVVITIIGILSGIVIVAIGDAVDRAKIAGSQRFSHSIRTRLALDMVGRWPFDNNTVDHSGWNNHGTPLDANHANADGNTPPQFVPGVTGQALSFDGVDDRVNAGNRPSLDITDAITLEAWINVRGVTNTSYEGIIYKKHLSDINQVTSYGLTMSWNNREVVFFISTSAAWGNNLFSIRELTLNRWYHIVATYNSVTGAVNLYIDGSLIRHGSFSGPILTSATPLLIGDRTDWFFNGIIDEVRIFSAALPTSYIQKRYVEGVKSLAVNGGITQEEKQQRIAELRNSGQLVIDLDAALVGPIDFSPYAHYFEALSLEATE